LIEQPLPEDLRVGLKLEKSATYGEAIALGQARAAIKGKTDAAREIGDRLEGKARQAVEVSGPEGGPLDLQYMTDGEIDARIGNCWRYGRKRRTNNAAT
jgi:hypothetical protein